MESLSTAGVRHWRISCALVRRLFGAKPLDYVRPVPPRWRGHALLAATRFTGSLHALDHRLGSARKRPERASAIVPRRCQRAGDNDQPVFSDHFAAGGYLFRRERPCALSALLSLECIATA